MAPLRRVPYSRWGAQRAAENSKWRYRRVTKMPKAYLGFQVFTVDLIISALGENYVNGLSLLERPLWRCFEIEQFVPHESQGWLDVHLE